MKAFQFSKLVLALLATTSTLFLSSSTFPPARAEYQTAQLQVDVQRQRQEADAARQRQEADARQREQVRLQQEAAAREQARQAEARQREQVRLQQEAAAREQARQAEARQREQVRLQQEAAARDQVRTQVQPKVAAPEPATTVKPPATTPQTQPPKPTLDWQYPRPRTPIGNGTWGEQQPEQSQRDAAERDRIRNQQGQMAEEQRKDREEQQLQEQADRERTDRERQIRERESQEDEDARRRRDAQEEAERNAEDERRRNQEEEYFSPPSVDDFSTEEWDNCVPSEQQAYLRPRGLAFTSWLHSFLLPITSELKAQAATLPCEAYAKTQEERDALLREHGWRIARAKELEKLPLAEKKAGTEYINGFRYVSGFTAKLAGRPEAYDKNLEYLDRKKAALIEKGIKLPPPNYRFHHRIPRYYFQGITENTDRPRIDDERERNFDYHAPENIKIVPGVKPNNIHQTQIHADWDDFDKNNPNPSWDQVLAFADFIDQKYSQIYWPD